MFFFKRTAPDAPTRRAHHGAELTYVFYNVPRSARRYDTVDRQLSETMSSYLVQFARTEEPNVSGLPNWPVYDARDDKLLVFGDRVEAREMPQKQSLDFFESVGLANRSNKR